MNGLDALLEAARGHLALTEWVSRNRPDLHRELFYLPITEMRVRLNEVTGLSIPGSESVVKGSAAYLERLIEISKQAPAGAVDNRSMTNSERPS